MVRRARAQYVPLIGREPAPHDHREVCRGTNALMTSNPGHYDRLGFQRPTGHGDGFDRVFFTKDLRWRDVRRAGERPVACLALSGTGTVRRAGAAWTP